MLSFSDILLERFLVSLKYSDNFFVILPNNMQVGFVYFYSAKMVTCTKQNLGGNPFIYFICKSDW